MRRAIVVLASVVSLAAATVATDPFAFLRPTVEVGRDDRRKLLEGNPVAHVVSARDRQVAIFAAVPVQVDGDRLVAWMRQIAQFKQSRYVESIRRFSDPPQIDDLADLALDDDELADLRRCRRGDCTLQLTGDEMDELRAVADAAGPEWKPALQQAMRRVVLRRVETYLTGGHSALSPFEDGADPTSLQETFSRLIRQSDFLAGLPDFSDYLERFPRATLADVESFVYWSKERLGRKAIISATHVSLIRGEGDARPEVIAAGKGIFATHYVNASLGLTALVGSGTDQRYLVYLNRSELDVLGGFFGGLARLFIERRLKNEADDVLVTLRHRLESGDPPPHTPVATPAHHRRQSYPTARLWLGLAR